MLPINDLTLIYAHRSRKNHKDYSVPKTSLSLHDHWFDVWGYSEHEYDKIMEFFDFIVWLKENSSGDNRW
jgi:hypothetical protein